MEEGFYERLLNEFLQLTAKVRGLKAFVSSKNIERVSVKQQHLLKQQLKYMEGYLYILMERIEDLDEEEQL